MDLFAVFILIIMLQRVGELAVARSNEKWMKSRGALEFGKGHYSIMVMIHASFFLFYSFEVLWGSRTLSSLWPAILTVIIITQAGRLWALLSLGKYWNTKILVIPHANVVMRGPYRFIRHPNYVIVTLEFLAFPLMFQAYWTLAVFSILNLAILSVRIPAEEQALSGLTEYRQKLQHNRFLPGRKRIPEESS
ncbi:isoprenylcysteine carboxyl methyltransferase family protein [Bacillus infantis]|uniref:isoprenylcysteine carboxyl methyltransferase family protein n=1 Tax=Bacillus infantis TaxID=324767 RepID=UPI003CF8B06F